MSAGALALLALLADDPVYPLGPLAVPDMTTPSHPLALTDLHYLATDDKSSTVQTLGVRLRVATWAFVSAEVDDQTRSVGFQTQRLDLGYTWQGDTSEIRAGYRAPHFLVHTVADRRSATLGWVLNSDAAIRLSPDLEILGTFMDDTQKDNPRLKARQLQSESVGFLYQRGARLELSGQASHTRLLDDAGFELGRNHASAAGTAIVFGFELDAEGGFERTTGRFPHDEVFETLGAVVPLGDHFLAQANLDNTWEPGLEHFEQDFRTALTFHARKIHLSRTGEAARLTTELARRACELGYNERRAQDPDGRRELRERLALSPRRQEFKEDLDALYRAEVDERNVLQAGLEYRSGFNAIRGSDFHTYRAFVAVPWPMIWPFRKNESAVSFLNLSYTRSEQGYEFPFSDVAHEVDLQVDLNREQSLFLRWSKPGRDPIEVARQNSRGRTIALEYVYAFGR